VNRPATQQKILLSEHWFLIGAALLWGTTGTVQAFAPQGYDPIVIGALRLLIGGFALLLLVKKSGETGNILAEPMTAATFGILVLGEQLNPQEFFGISLIFAGLVILVMKGRTPTRETT